jgi:hypothetical protein
MNKFPSPVVVTISRGTIVPDPQPHQSSPHSPIFLMMPPVKAKFFHVTYFLEIFRPQFFMYVYPFSLSTFRCENVFINISDNRKIEYT